MHKRPLAHFLVCVRHHINQVFGEKCIGQGGLVAWPSCVLDLNIMDFLLWRSLRYLVYAISVHDVEKLQHAHKTIRVNAGIFKYVW